MNDDQGNAISMWWIIQAGVFVMGGLTALRQLRNPRLFSLIYVEERNPISQKMEKVQKMQLSPLPGTPASIPIPNDSTTSLTYPIDDTEKNLLDLYHRVTHPEKPDDKKIIASDEGKVIKLQ